MVGIRWGTGGGCRIVCLDWERRNNSCGRPIQLTGRGGRVRRQWHIYTCSEVGCCWWWYVPQNSNVREGLRLTIARVAVTDVGGVVTREAELVVGTFRYVVVLGVHFLTFVCKDTTKARSPPIANSKMKYSRRLVRTTSCKYTTWGECTSAQQVPFPRLHFSSCSLLYHLHCKLPLEFLDVIYNTEANAPLPTRLCTVYLLRTWSSMSMKSDVFPSSLYLP